MIQGEKILVTGVTGAAAAPIAEFLARNNEVWGLARFLEPADPARAGKEIRITPLHRRTELEAKGIRTCSADLGSGDLSGVPDDFTYLLHFAFARIPPGPDQIELAYRTNAEGTGFILEHCRKAKAALVISSGTIYSPNEDRLHAYVENDPLGGAKAPWSPSSPVSKVIQEAIARYCARSFGLRTTIARLFTPYGAPELGPSLDIEAMQRGDAVFLMNGSQPHTAIHFDDLCDQIEPLLDAAGAPALVVNWTGDEVVWNQDWCETAGRLLGLTPKFRVEHIPGTHPGFIGDAARRRSITGPCRKTFADSFEAFIRAHHAQARTEGAA
jgi:nucleoside-diphosphate-sugar epimerase